MTAESGPFTCDIVKLAKEGNMVCLTCKGARAQEYLVQVVESSKMLGRLCGA